MNKEKEGGVKMRKAIVCAGVVFVFTSWLVQAAQADELLELKLRMKMIQNQMETLQEKIEKFGAERSGRIETPVQIEAPTQIKVSTQIEAPKGKTGVDFGNEAKRYVQGISTYEAKSIFNSDKSTIFVDVRRRSEYVADGYIEGSLDLSLGRLIFDIRMRIPNKDVPIITYCKKGMRAAIAGSQLVQMGYTNVKYLEGGILGWKNAGYPVVMSAYMGKIKMPAGKTPEDFLREARGMVGEGISPIEASRRRDSDPNTMILDVATRREHGLLGKIEGSLIMDAGKVAFNIKKKVHDANVPIITTCTAGKRGLLTAKILKEMGYKNVTYIQGGLNAWKKAGLPTATYVSGEEQL